MGEALIKYLKANKKDRDNIVERKKEESTNSRLQYMTHKS